MYYKYKLGLTCVKNLFVKNAKKEFENVFILILFAKASQRTRESFTFMFSDFMAQLERFPIF